MKMTTNMAGFQRWIVAHPRKRLTGYFLVNGKPLSHDEVIKIVNYAVEHGYRTEADIPDNEIAEVLKWTEC